MIQKIDTIKKIILIILLIFVVINLISTYFIVVYSIYNIKHKIYRGLIGAMNYKHFIIKGNPIPLEKMIYDILYEFKNNSSISRILLITILILIFYIPIFFASRIIFYLNPLFTRLNFTSTILFFILWVLINYIFLILILKKLDIDKVYKIELFFMPLAFNFCYTLSTSEYPGIGILIFFFLPFISYYFLKKVK